MLYGNQEIQLFRRTEHEMILMSSIGTIYLRPREDGKWAGTLHGVAVEVTIHDPAEIDMVEIELSNGDDITLAMLHPIDDADGIEPLYEVYQSLCTRDRRSVYYDSVYGWFDDDDLASLREPRTECSCDPCYSGTDKLGMTIIRILDL